MNLCFNRQIKFNERIRQPAFQKPGLSRFLNFPDNVLSFGSDSQSDRKINPKDLPEGTESWRLPWVREKTSGPIPLPDIHIIIERHRREIPADERPRIEISVPEPPRKKEG